jgi:uncharacterized repeat protein (TIGR03847 family)
MTETAKRFVIGALGPPGERVFYIHIVLGTEASWFVIEKLQAAAFAAQARELLDAIERSGAGRDFEPGTLDPPGSVSFRAGALSLEYDEDHDVVNIEVFPIEDEDEAESTVEFSVTPAQLDAAAREALAVVGKGRPPCPRCGLAMDPDGHPCPSDNGDLRSHQA